MKNRVQETIIRHFRVEQVRHVAAKTDFRCPKGRDQPPVRGGAGTAIRLYFCAQVASVGLTGEAGAARAD